jgi:N-acetylated-alpha-linked acidic dipeptidase
VTLAQTAGKAVLRLANSAVLPFQFSNSVRTIRAYVDQVEQLSHKMRSEVREHNLRVREGVAAMAADPLRTFVAPEEKREVPHLNFAPLHNAVSQLQEAARGYDRSVRRLSGAGEPLPEELQRDLDRVLRSSEQALILEKGLPGRPWYRHSLYAPGLYTGYGVKTLPAVREAIEQSQWTQAEEQIGLTAEALLEYSRVIEHAYRIVETND